MPLTFKQLQIEIDALTLGIDTNILAEQYSVALDLLSQRLELIAQLTDACHQPAERSLALDYIAALDQHNKTCMEKLLEERGEVEKSLIQMGKMRQYINNG